VKKLLLGCGSRTWPDVERAAVELAGYQSFELMHGDCPARHDGTPGGDQALDRAALAAGLIVGKTLHRRPAAWRKLGDAAGPIRNREMAAECKAILDAGGHVEGLALGSLTRADDPRRKSGTGDMVALLRALGVRVRWVPAPDAKAQTLALRVWTARLDGQPADPDDIDITRAGADRATRARLPFPGQIWAPSWATLTPALQARQLGGDAAEQAWVAYSATFLEEMRRSWSTHRPAWRAMLARDRVVLRCRCRDAARCHRSLVAGCLSKLGGVSCGELRGAAPRQLGIPGV
jgi:hypothetical protein